MVQELLNHIASLEADITEQLHSTGSLHDIADIYNDLQRAKNQMAAIEAMNPNPRLVELFANRMDGVSSKLYGVFNLWTGRRR